MAPDFSGWATKEGLRCADGLTIGKGAFQHQAQKMKVPLVWQHQHPPPSQYHNPHRRQAPLDAGPGTG